MKNIIKVIILLFAIPVYAADNIAVTAGAGNTVAFDEVTRNATSEKEQVIKISLGTENAHDLLLDSGQQNMANSMPITLASDQTWTGATNLGKAEDAAHSSGDVGPICMAVRTDTAANRSGTDGDYEPLQIAAGRLWTSALIDTALPAGTNAIGKLAANSGVDIGDVDVTSVVPGTGATNLGKAEDAAHSSGDSGVLGLSVRKDAAGTLAGTDGDYAPLQLDSNGALRVTGAGGGTQYNEDDAHASGNTGTLALVVRQDTAAQLAGTDGDYSALINDASGRLHVNVGNTVTVGSHAVTNAGTFAVQVDGSALTALQLIDNLVLAEDAAHTTADPGAQALAVRKATPANLSGADGDYEPLQINAGRLWTSAVIDTAIPAGTNNIGDVDVLSVVPGNGATALGKDEDAAHSSADTGVLALAVRRDSAAVGSGTDGDYSTLNVNGSGRLYTSATVDTALPAGTNAIGKLAANSGVDIGDVDVTSISAGTNSVGGVFVRPETSNGLTIYRNLDIDETGINIKGSAGQIYGYFIYNNASTTRFVKFYNKATAPTVGTDTPVLTFPIPPYGAANLPGTIGIAFDTGIGIGCVTGVADSSTGAPAANDCVVNIYYK